MNTVRMQRPSRTLNAAHSLEPGQAPHTPLPSNCLPPTRPPRDITKLKGEILDGRYIVEDHMAQGGMGHIYRVRLPVPVEGIELIRAAKIIDAQFLQSHHAISRFQREIAITLTLGEQSEHIVKMHDDFKVHADGFGYYVMELLHGETLAARLAKHKQDKTLTDIDWCVDIVCQICEALRVVHHQKMLHCDIKPDNIFLSRSPRHEKEFVKLIDFGIAQHHTTAFSSPHDRNYIVGTAPYMSPEQIRGTLSESTDSFTPSTPTIGCSDIYSLGCVFFEMLVGHPPFSMPSDNSVPEYNQILDKHLNARPSFPSNLCREIEPKLCDVVLRMLAKHPADRYHSAQEVLAALESQQLHSQKIAEAKTTNTPASVITAEPSQLGSPSPSSSPLPSMVTATPPQIESSSINQIPPEVSSTTSLTTPTAATTSLHRFFYIAVFALFVGFLLLGLMFGVMLSRQGQPFHAVAAPSPTPRVPVVPSTPSTPREATLPVVERPLFPTAMQLQPPQNKHGSLVGIGTPVVVQENHTSKHASERTTMKNSPKQKRSTRPRRKTCRLKVFPKGYLDNYTLKFSLDSHQKPQIYKSTHDIFKLPCHREIHVTVEHSRERHNFYPCTFLLPPISSHQSNKRIHLHPLAKTIQSSDHCNRVAKVVRQ